MRAWLKRFKNYLASKISEHNPWASSEVTVIAEDIETARTQVASLPPTQVSTTRVLTEFASFMFAKENLPRIFSATLLTGMSTGVNFLAPYLFAKTIESLTNEDEQIELGGIELSREALITLMVSTFALTQIIPTLRDLVLVRVTANNTKKIVEISTAHLLKKSLTYHINTPFSEQMFLIQKGFAVSSVVSPLLTQIAPTLIEAGVACAALTSLYGIEMGLGLLVLLSIYTGFSALTTKPIIESRKKMLKVGNDTWEKFVNALQNYKPMRDFGKFEFTMQQVSEALTQFANTDTNATSLPLKVNQGHVLISRISMLLAALYVGNGISQNKYTVEEFIILVSYLNQLCGLLPGFGSAVNQIFAAWPDLNFVFSELAKPDEVVDLNPTVSLKFDKETAPSIEFQEVCFTYPAKPGETEEKMVFDNLSFKVKAGQRAALVSESGAGKTTAFNLLYGYYSPNSGCIKINGQDISTVSLEFLQKSITLFGQNPNLFKGTIRENICYGSSNPSQVTDDEIWALARATHLEDFLNSLSKKLDTDTGEGGKGLSGGQQQKVAILRGLMKKGSIRLMDEITASLDSQAARETLTALNQMPTATTSLMITHKLSEITSVDLIIVLENGKAVAQGTHQELLESCALYKTLWNSYLSQNTEPNLSSTAKMLGVLGVDELPGDTLTATNANSASVIVHQSILHTDDSANTASDFDMTINLSPNK